MVSVPLRGVGCFCSGITQITASRRFRPLAGCGLFRHLPGLRRLGAVSVPLRGVGCFLSYHS